jgi:hypothetical protein
MSLRIYSGIHFNQIRGIPLTGRTNMEKMCIACGMTMQKPSDFALGDVTKDYCKYCVNEDGSLQTYDQRLESLTRLVQKQGMDEESARITAANLMAELPAWQDHCM